MSLFLKLTIRKIFIMKTYSFQFTLLGQLFVKLQAFLERSIFAANLILQFLT